ncbi:MAG: LysR family transcriptional regulator [Granulosicoccus sp.]
MKHLTTFRLINEIARTGSIRSAAEHAALTPSAVQRRIQSYETELGFEIFERGPKGVRLNAAGELVIQHVRETLAETARLQSRIADLSGLRRGHVAIGCSQAMATHFLPEQIARYQSEFPLVSFDIELLEHGAAAEMLDTYAVDMVLVFDEGHEPAYKAVAGFKQQLVAIMSASHPLADSDVLRLRQCYEYAIALPTAGFGGRRLIDRALFGKAFSKAPVVQSNSFEYLKSFVANTEAITFQIEIGADHSQSGTPLVSRPLASGDVQTGNLWLGQKHERPLPVAASRFMEQLSSELATRYEVL